MSSRAGEAQELGCNMMKDGLEGIRFPVFAVSHAGWSKAAATVGELNDASPDDHLEDWHGLEVYDSAGFVHRATRAFRAWPKSKFGLLLCRVFNESIHVGFEFGKTEPVELEVLVAHATAAGEIAEEDVWHSHEELLRAMTS